MAVTGPGQYSEQGEGGGNEGKQKNFEEIENSPAWLLGCRWICEWVGLVSEAKVTKVFQIKLKVASAWMCSLNQHVGTDRVEYVQSSESASEGKVRSVIQFYFDVGLVSVKFMATFTFDNPEWVK